MTNNSFSNLSAQQLRRAASIKEKIDSLQSELSRILGGASSTSGTGPVKKRRAMSAKTRALMAAAAKARWAKRKAAAKK